MERETEYGCMIITHHTRMSLENCLNFSTTFTTFSTTSTTSTAAARSHARSRWRHYVDSDLGNGSAAHRPLFSQYNALLLLPCSKRCQLSVVPVRLLVPVLLTGVLSTRLLSTTEILKLGKSVA
eukprot:scpid94353/ scgid7485/ 